VEGVFFWFTDCCTITGCPEEKVPLRIQLKGVFFLGTPCGVMFGMLQRIMLTLIVLLIDVGGGVVLSAISKRSAIISLIIVQCSVV